MPSSDSHSTRTNALRNQTHWSKSLWVFWPSCLTANKHRSNATLGPQVNSTKVGTARARLCPPYALASENPSILELERDVQLGAVGFDLALGVQLQIELDDLGDTKVAQGSPARLTAAAAAFSQDSLLVPISSMTL